MNTLVIVGNGFDLSHGLKTDYGSFLDYMVDEKINNQESNKPDKGYNMLFSHIYDKNRLNYELKRSVFYLKDNEEGKASGLIFIVSHLLNEILLKRKQNWCDIEGTYYEYIHKDENKDKTAEINDDFEIIKQKLNEYLLEVTPNN